MTRSLVRYRQPLQPPKATLARPIRRRSFANEILVSKFDRYLEVIKRSPLTRIKYAAWLKQFGAFLDGKNFAVATREDVRGFLATLFDRNVQKGTIASALYALRNFYRFLQLGDQVLIEVPRQVQVTKIPKRLPHALSLQEIKRILAAAGTPRNLALLELAFASGLRVSELANLRIEEVNLKARSLVVREGKGGNDRIGLFGRPAAAALRAYLGDRTSGFVFQPEPRRQKGGVTRGKGGDWWRQWREGGKMHSIRLGDYEIPTAERARQALADFLRAKLPPAKEAPPERRLSPRSIFRIVVKVAKRAGIEKKVGPHTFRHSCFTACLNGGMDIRYIQQLAGHKNLNFTQRYLHISMDRLKATHTRFLKRG
jgi:site-specific recombinase XerD